ncbi:CaiB/BaiF CoA transferase family protein [Stakelama tenebrarum]|uniref:CoA transferase n=1 Tax=Stakelama tenebrarum TaxID=2711215 RepID=A0A6G6Y882_9SPHN|nr:CaiB/BaiF CoA-transferase family protein [Sphingosinithalassobacter tenebrarum]QIG80783.1 CoA transferase [Sphingosinithalassobacter tenebrarum]
MSLKQRGGPLAGVRVLELTKVWAGPETGKQLAFLGAEVIKVESEGSLDVTRFYGVDDINQAPGFQSVNPQKLSCQINMKSPEGMGLLKRLIAECDIVVENLRPGAMKRLGLDYAALKALREDVILVSMGMYGNDGPLANQTGYAPCFVALGGLSGLVGYAGETPQGMNVRYADSTFGTAAAFAALVALNHRKRTGEGQFIDVSAVEAMTSMIGDSFMDYSLNGRIAACDGNAHAEMAPHGVYRCSGNDWIAISAANDAQWGTLAGLLGLGDNARFATLADRKANENALDALITDWTRSQDAKALAEKLQGAGVPAAKSANSVDLIADEHFWGREFYPMTVDGAGNAKPIIGPSWRMTGGAEITDGAPSLGEHNAYVFGEILGIDDAERERLVAEGVTR